VRDEAARITILKKMRLTFDSKQEVKVEGKAVLRKGNMDDVEIERENEGQTWFLETKAGNQLTLAAIGDIPEYGGGDMFKVLDKDLACSDADKLFLVKHCPIAMGIFYFVTKDEGVFAYDPIQTEWIRMQYSNVGMLITFRAIYLRMLDKMNAFDRECQNAKNLQRVANALEDNAFTHVVLTK